jgi:hypothetical protein
MTHDITQLLNVLERGDPHAARRLLPQVPVCLACGDGRCSDRCPQRFVWLADADIFIAV